MHRNGTAMAIEEHKREGREGEKEINTYFRTHVTHSAGITGRIRSQGFVEALWLEAGGTAVSGQRICYG